MFNNDTSRSSIAVVGVAALFPGSAEPDGFWKNIVNGQDLMSDVPASHWHIDDYYDPNPAVPGKTYARRGAFLPQVPFDPVEYGVPPHNLSSTDTVQLLSLIVAQRLIADVYDKHLEKMPRSETSVILGATTATELITTMSGSLQRPIWAKALQRFGLPENQIKAICDDVETDYATWTENTFPGLLNNVVAGRIASRFDLGGTNCVIDAACASSLGAIQMAAQSLLLGQSDLVITGGVDAFSDIFTYMCFSKTPALSRSEICRPFSKNSDGTMLGEGIAMFALRRLADAERDENKIYAVVRGIGASSDGRAKSIYAPRPEGQATALRRAYAAAGFGPETVELVEAHGTGTVAGDTAEFSSLKTVFSEANREGNNWCALGSVKSQIGHTKGAAGAAAFYKAVMALHHGILPPTINIQEPNPDLGITHSPFYLNTATRPWIRNENHPRRAALSSFGFGGSNFHIAVEEYKGPGLRPKRIRTVPSELFLLSANDPAALDNAMEELVEGSTLPNGFSVKAQESQKRFQASAKYRLSIVAKSSDDLKMQISNFRTVLKQDPGREFSSPLGTDYATGPAIGGLTCFLFPGQGSQYVNMGADLAMTFERSNEICSILATATLPGRGRLSQTVYPAPVFSEEEGTAQTEAMKATDCAQPAIAVMSRMLIDLLTAAGVQADVAAGHSFGELTALFYARVLNEHDFFEVARQRGLLSAEAGRKSASGMLAVVGSPEEIESTKEFLDDEITIANDNSPEQLVYCGPLGRIEELATRLAKGSIKAHLLKVDAAFHSRFVRSAVEPFHQYLKTVPFRSPQIPVYANTAASPYTDDMDEGRKIFASQLAEQVRFREQTENLYQSGVRVFIEVGPSNALSGLVGQCLKNRPHLAIPTDVRKQNGITSLWRALGRLAIAGRPVDLSFSWAEYDVLAANPEPVGRSTVSINGANLGKPSPAASRKPKQANHISARQEALGETAPLAMEAGTKSAVPGNGTSVHDTMTPRQSHPVLPEHFTSVPVPQAHHDQDASIQTLLLMKQHSTEVVLKAQRALIDAQIGFFKTAEIAMENLLGAKWTASTFAIENAIHPTSGRPSLSSNAHQGIQPVASFPPPPLVDRSRPGTKASEPMPLATNAQSLDFKRLLYQVVAEKTGYPEDILTLEMGLESDLGIDSIKRIDILSALQERVPGLNGSETSKLSTLQTLGAILNYLAPNVETQVQPMFSSSSASPIPSPGGQDLRQLLYKIVAEKTGYPEDILTLEMSLEADLGIDSIKRIDILSALQERVPGLSGPETSKLGTLQTLGAILNYLTPNFETQVQPMVSSLSASPIPSPAGQDLKQLLYKVVAEKTGYPEEILTLEMGLESDLGIDSIKRIDILSALQERVPGLSESGTSKLGTLQTLGAILAHITSGPPTVVSTDGAVSKRQGSYSNQVIRIGLQFVPTAPPGKATPGLLTARMVAVVSKDVAIAQKLAASLESHGVCAVSAKSVPPEADGVIVLAGFGESTGFDDLMDEAKQTFLAANAFAARASENGGLFVAIYDSEGDLDLAARAGLGGIVGLTKTAALEWPHAMVRAIDVAHAGRSVQALISVLVDELLTGGDEKEIKVRSDGSRVRVDSIPLPIQKTLARQNVATERPFLVVSGGGHGITADCLVHLAQHAPLRVLLLGRTSLEMESADTKDITDPATLQRRVLENARRQGGALSPRQLDDKVRALHAVREIRRTLDQLVVSGSEARYEAVDILDSQTLTQQIQETRRIWGPVQGIIHGAGVSWPKLIESTDETQFDTVFQIKVRGLQNLLSATANDPLRSIFLFSSVAGRYGNVGQADYAMANETLSKIARAEARKRGNSCCVRALIWGPWEGGLVTPAISRLFRERGVPLLPIQQGAELFASEWEDQRCGLEQSEVILMASSPSGIQNPILEEVAHV